MPEVRDEAREFLGEVRRLRPEWLSPRPNREVARRRQFDWVRTSGGFWDRARLTPDAEARALTLVEGTMVDEARAFAEDARKHTFDTPLKYETVSLSDIRACPTPAVKGWNGDVVEPWRIAALVVVSSVIERDYTSHAFVEWLANEIDLAKALADRASWNRFWLHEVLLVNMPRHWLRWAFEMLQSLQRSPLGHRAMPNSGVYLTQCDWFFTADKAFGEMVTQVAEAAPFRVASAKVVLGGPAAIAAMSEALESH